MERETRIELATNSLEGCDSTIELLPLFFIYNNLGQFRLYQTEYSVRFCSWTETIVTPAEPKTDVRAP